MKIKILVLSFLLLVIPSAAVMACGSPQSIYGRAFRQISPQFLMPVYKATIELRNAQGGLIQTARTNPFGYYRFEEIPVGETCILTVRHKGYQFSPQILAVFEEITDFNFMAEK